MPSRGYTYRARQRPAEMLQSVACLVSAGKTVALRAAVPPGPHPPPGDLHRQPGVRHSRAVCHDRPGAGRPAPLPQSRADGPGRRPARRRGRRAAPPRRGDLRGSSPPAGPARGATAPDELGDGFGQPVRRHPGRAAHFEPAAAHGHLRRPGPADRHPVHRQADGPRRIRRLPAPSPEAGWPGRAAVRRRRHRPPAPRRQRPAPRPEQRCGRRAHRRRDRRQGPHRRRLRQKGSRRATRD